MIIESLSVWNILYSLRNILMYLEKTKPTMLAMCLVRMTREQQSFYFGYVIYLWALGPIRDGAD